MVQWTSLMIKRLESLDGKVANLNELAIELDVPNGALRHKVEDLGLKIKWTKDTFRWCPVCATYRTYKDGKDCRVCTLNRQLEQLEEDNKRARQALKNPPEIKERTHTRIEEEKPKYPNTLDIPREQRGRALTKFYKELESWEIRNIERNKNRTKKETQKLRELANG